jgi:hypothetical protein
MTPRPGPIDVVDAIDAFLASTDWVAGVLESDLVATHWEEPSALEGMTVAAVAGHLFLAVRVVARQLDAAPGSDGAAVVSMPLAYRRSRLEDADDLAGDLARQVRDDGQHVGARGPAVVVARFDKLRAELRARLTGPDATRTTIARQDGTVAPFGDFLVSRIVEVIVHGDDLAVSVGLDAPDPPPAASALAIELLVRGAREHVGDLAVLREMTRQERSTTDALRAL